MDPLSAPTAAVAFVGASYTAASALFRAIQDFCSYRADARRLSHELQALLDMLNRLDACARQSSDNLTFDSLEIPLKQCRRSCDDVRRLVERCTRHGGSVVDGDGKGRKSVRDWAMLKYKGKEMAGFVEEVGGYKDIIGITLAGVTLQKMEMTLEVARRFDNHLYRAEAYFETVIEQINDKLERVCDIGVSTSLVTSTAGALPTPPGSTINEQNGHHDQSSDVILTSDENTITTREITLFELELASAEACLGICDRYREQIAQTQLDEMRVQPTVPGAVPSDALNNSIATASGGSIRSSDSFSIAAVDTSGTAVASISVSDVTRSQLAMMSVLKNVDGAFSTARTQFETHRQDAVAGLEVAKARASNRESRAEQEQQLEQQRQQLADELAAMKQCKSLCSEVQVTRTNRLKNVSVGKGGRQLLVSQFDQLFDAENVTAGEGAVQAVGSMPGEAILELVRRRTGERQSLDL